MILNASLNPGQVGGPVLSRHRRSGSFGPRGGGAGARLRLELGPHRVHHVADAGAREDDDHRPMPVVHSFLRNVAYYASRGARRRRRRAADVFRRQSLGPHVRLGRRAARANSLTRPRGASDHGAPCSSPELPPDADADHRVLVATARAGEHWTALLGLDGTLRIFRALRRYAPAPAIVQRVAGARDEEVDVADGLLPDLSPCGVDACAAGLSALAAAPRPSGS